MKRRVGYRIRPYLIAGIFLLMGTVLSGQEMESKSVVFHLDNKPDREAPEVHILSPRVDENNLFKTDVAEIELLGEVKDKGMIKFLTVNSRITEISSSGNFAELLKLNPGVNIVKISSRDEHDNEVKLQIYLQYEPPVVTLADKIREESTYYALVIGIESYRDPDITDLDNPINDAEAVYNALVSNYTFEPENMRLLKNPRRSEIIRELDELRLEISENDNLLIFYAGHGHWDADAEIGYWLPSDASLGTTADWFRNSTLVDYLQAIHSRHTLLITDACFAGSIFKARSFNLDKEVVYDRIYEMPSRKAMTSGAKTEVPDKSAFVKYLVKRLDENQETYLSSEELFSSFRMAVISNSSALPQYGEIQNVGNEGGDFIFLKRQ